MYLPRMTLEQHKSAGIGDFLREVWPYIRPQRWKLTPVLLACAVEMAFSAQVPLALKYLIDKALGQNDRRTLILILSALALGSVAVSLAGLARDYIYSKVVTRAMADMRLQMFEQLQRLSLDFYLKTELGDVLSHFSSDLHSVHDTLMLAVAWLIQPALDLLFCSVVVFAFEWKLALAGMLLCPLCVIGPRILSQRALDANSHKQDRESSLLSTVQENVSAPALVRAYNLQDMFVSWFSRRNSDLMQAGMRFGFISSAMDRAASLGTLLLQVVVMAIGGYMAFHGSLSAGTFASFLALFMSLSYSFGYIAQFSPNLINAAGGMDRIYRLLTEQPKVNDAPRATALPPFSREIEFRDVCFSYDRVTPNLDHLNLTIPRGASVAFVGPSGSGKSTVLNLLLRFYDPASGSVTIDGVDLRESTQESLRSQVATVFQDNFMFNTSIRENIAVGKPGATDDEIVAAAKAAEIHDFISSLPNGYATEAGERGSRFSGGQRQRFAIARAVLRNPSILILDEATSALDSATEAAINQTFQRIARGRTMIAVTHRLSSAIHADRIFVLERGHLVEQGRHADLLRSNGLYARMWQRQAGLVLSANDMTAAVAPEWLRLIPLLQGVDNAALQEMVRWFATDHFRENHTIFEQEDPGTRFYILVRGKVEIVKTDPAGKPQRVAVLEDGDYFGEMALLNNTPRNATIRTLTPCICLSLQRDHFLGLVARNPSIQSHVAAAMAARV
jgi:ATP-binding cassette subfamily B protein